jgi:Cysteine-rich secretory protein family
MLRPAYRLRCWRRTAHHPGARTLAALVLSGSAAAAHADPVDVVNALRAGDCSNRVKGAQLEREPSLDSVAREMARDASLEDAIERSGYPAASSQSIHVRGSLDDDGVRVALGDNFCAALGDPRYEEIGIFTRREDLWIVLAVRRPAPPVLEPESTARRVLELVNAARAMERDCGQDHFAPAAPVALSATLSNAASAHSVDMAATGVLSHRGSDGTSSAERITRAGYAWRASGENVAAGQQDADAVVAAWLTSPGHCANVMGEYFTEMGLAFALAPGKNPDIYWTQVFAAPSSDP